MWIKPTLQALSLSNHDVGAIKIVPLQQCETTEALRTALGRMEAALMAREQKLADSYKVLRIHADGLRSGAPHGADSSLKVRLTSSFAFARGLTAQAWCLNVC